MGRGSGKRGFRELASTASGWFGSDRAGGANGLKLRGLPGEHPLQFLCLGIRCGSLQLINRRGDLSFQRLASLHHIGVNRRVVR